MSQRSDEAVVCAGGRWGLGWKVFNWQADFFFLCLPWLVIENEGGGFFLCLPFPSTPSPFPLSPPPPLPLSPHPSWLARGQAAPRLGEPAGEGRARRGAGASARGQCPALAGGVGSLRRAASRLRVAVTAALRQPELGALWSPPLSLRGWGQPFPVLNFFLPNAASPRVRRGRCCGERGHSCGPRVATGARKRLSVSVSYRLFGAGGSARGGGGDGRNMAPPLRSEPRPKDVGGAAEAPGAQPAAARPRRRPEARGVRGRKRTGDGRGRRRRTRVARALARAPAPGPPRNLPPGAPPLGRWFGFSVVPQLPLRGSGRGGAGGTPTRARSLLAGDRLPCLPLRPFSPLSFPQPRPVSGPSRQALAPAPLPCLLPLFPWGPRRGRRGGHAGPGAPALQPHLRAAAPAVGEVFSS